MSIAAGQQAPPASGYAVEDYLGMALYSSVRVSPDGRSIVFVTSRDDVRADSTDTALWRVDVGADGRAGVPVRLTTVHGALAGLTWSPDGRTMVFLGTDGPGRPPQLVRLDPSTGATTPLTDVATLRAPVGTYAWVRDGRALVFTSPLPPTPEERSAAGRYGDVRRTVPTATPQTRILRLALDGDGAAAAESLATVSGAVVQASVSPDGRWLAYGSGSPTGFPRGAEDHEIHLLPLAGAGEQRRLTDNRVFEQALLWDEDGRSLYTVGVGEPGADRSIYTQGRVYRIRADDGALEPLTTEFAGEIAPGFVPLAGGEALLNGTWSTSSRLLRLDPAAGRMAIVADYRGRVTHLSASRDGRIVAFVGASPHGFPEVYLAHGLDGVPDAAPITDGNAGLAAQPTPEVEVTRWATAAGDTVEAVLFWPPGRRGGADLPTIVSLHGGPWLNSYESLAGYESFAFAYYPALLASRGYLVLDPNYRGSVGRGDEFVRALENRGCSAPAEDVLAGVDALVARGHADSVRLGVMGYSYGGVVTNCLLGRTDRFRAAASGGSIFNMTAEFGMSVLEHQTNHRFAGRAPWEDVETYWRESPISGAGRMRTPTIVTVGDADPLTPPGFSRELYRALVRNGTATELLVFPGQGHQFTRPVHKLVKVQAELEWIERHLRDRSLSSRPPSVP